MIYQKKSCVIYFLESNEGLRCKSCVWSYFFQGMVVEILSIMKFKIFFFSNQFIL
jgi:hypothetical protein